MNVLFGGAPPTPAQKREARNAVLNVAIEDIEPQRGQPRQKFHDQALKELASSIKQHGILVPIVTRRKGRGYEIIAGERRWRAAQLAGLKSVEVVVKDFAEDQVFLLALIENIQREDLNPIEEAEAYKRIIDDRDLTQEQLAKAVGKDRSSVANALRLLKLPDRVRKMVADTALSMGHARALLALPTPEAMTKTAQEIIRRGLSVREVERLVKRQKTQTNREEPTDPYAMLPGGAEAVRRETESLMRRLGTRVRFVVNGRKGKIEIDFSSVDELNRLLDRIKE